MFSFILCIKFLTGGEQNNPGTIKTKWTIRKMNQNEPNRIVIINRKKLILFINILVLVSYGLVFYICHLMDCSPIQTIFFFSLTGTIMTLFDNFLFMMMTKVSIPGYIKFIAIYIFCPIMIASGIRVLLFG